MQRYKEKMKILLSKEDYLRLEKITQQFVEDKNIGPKLQNFLLDRQQKLDNWAYQYWIDDMYYANKFPLPIYSSPGYINRKKFQVEDVCRLGSQVVCFSIMIEKLMKQYIFPKERTFKKLPYLRLCMDQYYRLFYSYRIPGKDKDQTVTPLNIQNNKHIIVISDNDFYYVPIKVTEEGVDENELYNYLQLIRNNKQRSRSIPIGILTSLERREWWKVRNYLIKDPTNKSNIDLIERAMFVMCLDKPVNEDIINMDEDNRSVILLGQSLHGGGSQQNSGNRWFDKTTQIMISEKHMGFCFEHSAADGVVSTCLIERLYNNNNKDRSNLNFSKPEHKKMELVKLNWILDNNLLNSINNACLKFDKLINDLDLQVYTFQKYGSNFIKSHKCSSDAFVQLLLQLTYFKMYKKPCAHYESGSIRKFKKGRFDCIRSTTPEAFEWVREMAKPATDNTKRYKLWKNAVKAQSKETEIVALGQGIDLHLLGLREAAKEVLDEMPDLFTDTSYSVANKFIVSTSQTGNDPDVVWAFGPVVNDGYGVSYSIQINSIIVVVSSFHSCTTTSTTKFLEAFKESLQDVTTMIENQNSL